MEDNFQRLHRPAIAFDAILGPIVQLRQHMERLVQDTRHADYSWSALRRPFCTA